MEMHVTEEAREQCVERSPVPPHGFTCSRVLEAELLHFFNRVLGKVQAGVQRRPALEHSQQLPGFVAVDSEEVSDKAHQAGREEAGPDTTETE